MLWHSAQQVWSESSRIDEVHYRALLERDEAAVRGRHQQVLELLQGVSTKLMFARIEPGDVGRELRQQQSPDWLVTKGMLTLEQASVIAGRAVEKPIDFADVGHWRRMRASDGSYKQHNPPAPLYTDPGQRLWTIQLEPGWYAVMTINEQIIVTPFPGPFEPTPVQREMSEEWPGGAESL